MLYPKRLPYSSLFSQWVQNQKESYPSDSDDWPKIVIKEVLWENCWIIYKVLIERICDRKILVWIDLISLWSKQTQKLHTHACCHSWFCSSKICQHSCQAIFREGRFSHFRLHKSIHSLLWFLFYVFLHLHFLIIALTYLLRRWRHNELLLQWWCSGLLLL